MAGSMIDQRGLWKAQYQFMASAIRHVGLCEGYFSVGSGCDHGIWIRRIAILTFRGDRDQECLLPRNCLSEDLLQ